MVELIQTSSGLEPVNTSVKLTSSNSNSNTVAIPKQEEDVESGSKTLIVEVPLKMEDSKEEQEIQQWNGYRACVLSQSMVHNYTNFNRSEAPVKLMQWSDEKWVELSDEVFLRAKSAFVERNPMLEIEVDGNTCIFDFFRMLQIDVVSGLHRSISWIDVNGKCYFPKFFIDESQGDNDYTCDETPKIEIEIKLDANDNNNNRNLKNSIAKRKREGKLVPKEDIADSAANSETGKPKRHCFVKCPAISMWPNARLMTEGERQYPFVRDLFMNGMNTVDPGVRITAIHHFTRSGPLERARWEVFYKQLEITKAARGQSQSRCVFAWHGVSKKGVLDILARGFASPTRVSGPQAHGIGVYLSPARLPHVSDVLSDPDENGEQHILLCRVILGNVEKVEAGSKQFFPSSVKFDTGVDDVVNPLWYVVWTTNMATHILPECVVSYKHSDRRQGPNMGPGIMRWIPQGTSTVVARLFSKLGRSLPAAKREQMKALCIVFNTGRMTKVEFIRRLRAVVGNVLLQAAISEIQQG